MHSGTGRLVFGLFFCNLLHLLLTGGEGLLFSVQHREDMLLPSFSAGVCKCFGVCNDN